MKRKIFIILVLLVTLSAGCGTATNNDVPTNGVTEAPSVTEPTTTLTPTSTPTPEPTATPEPTSTPTPKPTEAPVVSKADWKDFEVTLGGYTIKLRETTLGELLDTGFITLMNEEEKLAAEISFEYQIYLETETDSLEFYAANFESHTVKSPSDCVLMEARQFPYEEAPDLKLGICGISVGDDASQSILEAALGKCDEIKDLNGDGSLMTYSWYVNEEDINHGYVRFNIEGGKVSGLWITGPYY